jgi:tRNA-Thr(GGU) m(6)t(6)A37 methyltransferase TsaA
MSSGERFAFEPVGIIHSCFKESFGIPRQAGLVPANEATLHLLPPYDVPDALRGLQGFSHVWILFVFHGEYGVAWAPLVRPPRLGGNDKIGVFASRSPHRPNPIGLSAVKLLSIDTAPPGVRLRLGGGDFLDGTPVLDVKPYVSYADALPDATSGYAAPPPGPVLQVEFSDEASAQCEAEAYRYPQLKTLITQMLALDPRPAYLAQQGDGRVFGCRLLDFDVKWTVREAIATVIRLEVPG